MRAHVPRTTSPTRAGKSAVLAAAAIAVAGDSAPPPGARRRHAGRHHPVSLDRGPTRRDVKLSLTVVSATPDVVNLDVGGLPDGWTATLRGGGFVIHSITPKPDTGAAADLEIAVPPDASPGEYPITVTGQDASGGRSSRS